MSWPATEPFEASSGMKLSAGGQETVSFKSSGAASMLKPDGNSAVGRQRLSDIGQQNL